MSHSNAKRWLQAIGPDNVRLLKDIRVHQPYTQHKLDWCSATRFIAQMARSGIALPERCVTGFVRASIQLTESVSPCRYAWVEVDEEGMTRRGDFDILWDETVGQTGTMWTARSSTLRIVTRRACGTPMVYFKDVMRSFEDWIRSR